MLAKGDELFAMFADHWDEIALNKQVMRLKPNLEQYRVMDQQGMLLLLGAFLNDGTLIGYSVNFIVNHLHYADLRVATNDLLFIARDHRGGRLGLQLIAATEAKAKERGAQLMLWHAKQETALNNLLPRLGYGVQDIIYSRGL